MNCCHYICYIGVIVVFVAIALLFRELIHHLTKPSEPTVNTGISSASDDVLEVDQRLNLVMSEATPLTIIFIIGGVAFTMLASFFTHRKLIQPWRNRNTQREEEDQAHRHTTSMVLEQIQNRLETVEDGRGARMGRPHVEERQERQNPYYTTNGLTMIGLQHALHDLAHHQEHYHLQNAQQDPRGLPAPPAPAPTPQGSHGSQQSRGFPQGPQGSQVKAERTFGLPKRGNI